MIAAEAEAARPRIAYLITAYRPPGQLLRLLATLRAAQPHAALVVCHSVPAYEPDPADLDALGGEIVVLRPGNEIVWGDFSLVDAHWTSIRWMLEHVAFDWLILMTEQDYPSVPLEHVEAHLAAADADVFADVWAVEPPAREAGTARTPSHRHHRRELRRRYHYSYRHVLTRPRWAARTPAAVRRLAVKVGKLAVGVNRVQPWVRLFPLLDRSCIGWRCRSTPYRPDFPCWFGEAWMALSHPAVQRLVDYLDANPGYVAFCRRTMIPVESATLTVLANDPSLRLCPRSLHYVNWINPKSGRPGLVHVSDLPAVAAGGRFFVRKVDIDVEPAVVEALDRKVFGPPHCPSADPARASHAAVSPVSPTS